MVSVRDRLLQAAEEMLDTDANAVSVESTAELAGVGRSTAYRYFPGRTELFLGLAAVRSNRLLDAARAVVAGAGTGAERLEELFVFMFNELPRDPVLAGVIAEGPVGLDTPRGREAADTFLGGLITEAQNAGEFRREYPPTEAVRWLVIQLLTAINMLGDDEDRFRNWLRWFILPSLTSPVTAQDVAQDVAAGLRSHARAIIQAADRIDGGQRAADDASSRNAVVQSTRAAD
jgi:AcrR family transcriptional regulator